MNQLKPLYSRFLDLPEEYTSWDAALCCLIQAPFENTTSFQLGTASGPQATLRASEEIELYDIATGNDLSDLAICVSSAPKLAGLSTKDALPLIEAQVDKALGAHKWPLVVGGEQTVSYAAVRAIIKKFPELCVVQLDAHLDLKDIYKGSNFSHRSASRRLLELGVSMLHVGARSYSRDEAEFALSASKRLTVFNDQDFRSSPEKLSALLSKIKIPIYLSVDMSVLDPSVCPGVSNPETSGLTWNELKAFVNTLFEKHTVVGADIVELSPIPGESRSELIAAQLAMTLFNLHQTGTTP